MSTEIETKMKHHGLIESYGGKDKGMVMQVTSNSLRIRETITEQLQDEGFISLTMEEASSLLYDLSCFVKREAMRRQGLLKAELDKLGSESMTVFHEISKLTPELFDVPATCVDMVSRFCKK